MNKKDFKYTTHMYVEGWKWTVNFLHNENKVFRNQLGYADYTSKTIVVAVQAVNHNGKMFIDRTAKILMHELGHAHMHTLPLHEYHDFESKSEEVANLWENAYLYSKYVDEIVNEANKVWKQWGKKETVVEVKTNNGISQKELDKLIDGALDKLFGEGITVKLDKEVSEDKEETDEDGESVIN